MALVVMMYDFHYKKNVTVENDLYKLPHYNEYVQFSELVNGHCHLLLWLSGYAEHKAVLSISVHDGCI